MSIADLIAYVIVFSGCVYFGRRLYDGWVPAIFLGLVSPIGFGLVGGLLVTVELSIVDVVRGVFGLPKVNSQNEVIVGACMIISAVLTVAGLWKIAQREGAKAPAKDHKAEPNKTVEDNSGCAQGNSRGPFSS